MPLVQAFEANNITKKNMLPDYREWLKKFLSEFLSGKKVSILETKGDFYVLECAESFYLCSRKEPFPIGVIGTESSYFVEASFILPKYQGLGLGMFLYEVVLKHLGKLFSSTNLSKGSSATWKKLVTKYNGVLVLDKKIVGRPKDVELKVQGWVVVKGVTYPVFDTAKGRKSLLQITKLLKNDNSREARLSYYKVTFK
jgi:GNAT superfamily N-acetyltransferase